MYSSKLTNSGHPTLNSRHNKAQRKTPRTCNPKLDIPNSDLHQLASSTVAFSLPFNLCHPSLALRLLPVLYTHFSPSPSLTCPVYLHSLTLHPMPNSPISLYPICASPYDILLTPFFHIPHLLPHTQNHSPFPTLLMHFKPSSNPFLQSIHTSLPLRKYLPLHPSPIDCPPSLTLHSSPTPPPP